MLFQKQYPPLIREIFVSYQIYAPFRVFSFSSILVKLCYNNYIDYYTLNLLSLFWLAESVRRIFEISACDVITADYTIVKVTGNQVEYDRGAWFLRVIARFVLLAVVKKHKHEFFCFVQCIIKQLLDSVSVISRTIKVSVRVTSRSRRLRHTTLTETLTIQDITKT